MHKGPPPGQTTDLKILRRQVGEQLRRLRKGRGLTQRMLADQLGFDYYTFIAQIEAGRGRVPSERFGAYARALGMPVRDFTRMMLSHYEPVIYQHLFTDDPHIPSQSGDNIS